jgi:hypothetical protein
VWVALERWLSYLQLSYQIAHKDIPSSLKI